VPQILLSYRREDSAAHAGRIADRLREHFGTERVFIDVDTIAPGEDFVRAIERSVNACEVVIAVIGKRWVSALQEEARLHTHDFVRLEIATALRRDVWVVPVLVADAPMPRAEELPEDLAPLARRQALKISDERFHRDVDRLIEGLASPIPDPSRSGNSWRHGRSRWAALARHRRAPWIAAALLAAVLLALAVPHLWRRITDRRVETIEVAPTDARSSQNPLSMNTGATYRLTLGANEEAYFRLETPSEDPIIVLDGRCATGDACVLGVTLSVLDEDGGVLENAPIRINAYDIAFRNLRAFDLPDRRAGQLKVVNSGAAIETWVTVLPSDTSGALPLFGAQPERLQIGDEAVGALPPRGAAVYWMDLAAGAYSATLDVSVAPRSAEVLSAYASIVGLSGDESRVAVSTYGVSDRKTDLLSISQAGSYWVRVQTQGKGANYLFKLTRKSP
jgi:hypothetical protein